jgi:hypothetical protein
LQEVHAFKIERYELEIPKGGIEWESFPPFENPIRDKGLYVPDRQDGYAKINGILLVAGLLMVV